MREIPGMTTAMFSILSPRKHILDHRGPYKGVLRYHLGLIVPEDAESCRIRVGEDFRHWQEGESMIFDDTFNHEVWNDTDETRVVLFVDVLRPLPEPESTINRLIVKAIGYSPFVLDAKRNQEAWERRYRGSSAQRRRRRGRSRRRSLDARGAVGSRLTPRRRPASVVPAAASLLACELSIVNSPVTISTPSTIITTPPIAMITGKWRLTTASASVMRSNARAISRNGIARPAE